MRLLQIDAVRDGKLITGKINMVLARLGRQVVDVSINGNLVIIAFMEGYEGDRTYAVSLYMTDKGLDGLVLEYQVGGTAELEEGDLIVFQKEVK